MSEIFHHEGLARGADAMNRIAAARILICGAGALGANLVENLARSGFGSLGVVDFDRIEERNLGTQPWSRQDVGSVKVKTLANLVFRATGTTVTAHSVRLCRNNIKKLLRDCTVAVDCFDNGESRAVVADYCLEQGVPCLHVGTDGGFASALWNDGYKAPSSGKVDGCDYPMARSMVLLMTAVATELLIRHLVKDERLMATFTLDDLKLSTYS